MIKPLLKVSWFYLLSCLHIQSSLAAIYTIGSYDQNLVQQGKVVKLGKLSAADIPKIFPKSFLEQDGSYGGGEVFTTFDIACHVLKRQIASGLLSNNSEWNIYILEASWKNDTYQLKLDDYRIKYPVKVLKKAVRRC